MVFLKMAVTRWFLVVVGHEVKVTGKHEDLIIDIQYVLDKKQ